MTQPILPNQISYSLKKIQNLLGLPSWDNGPTKEITCTTQLDLIQLIKTSLANLDLLGDPFLGPNTSITLLTEMSLSILCCYMVGLPRLFSLAFITFC